MKFAVAIIILAGTVTAAVLDAQATAAAQQPKSQWDGVYTEEQAKRGERVYAHYCASCHGPDLAGGEMAPGLTGGEFSANWNDLSLAWQRACFR
jgi:mono/diheme cytochrome c family protein